MIIIVMGVSASGKTTIGKRLAGRLGWVFADADDYHPTKNVQKMAAGEPLNDKDRQPWLEALRNLIETYAAQDQNLVLACSALKRSYRQLLASGPAQISWVYLKADRELIRQRLKQREDHYMPPELLESQFEAMQEPEQALVIPADWSPPKIVDEIMDRLEIKA